MFNKTALFFVIASMLIACNNSHQQKEQKDQIEQTKEVVSSKVETTSTDSLIIDTITRKDGARWDEPFFVISADKFSSKITFQNECYTYANHTVTLRKNIELVKKYLQTDTFVSLGANGFQYQEFTNTDCRNSRMSLILKNYEPKGIVASKYFFKSDSIQYFASGSSLLGHRVVQSIMNGAKEGYIAQHFVTENKDIIIEVRGEQIKMINNNFKQWNLYRNNEYRIALKMNEKWVVYNWINCLEKSNHVRPEMILFDDHEWRIIWGNNNDFENAKSTSHYISRIDFSGKEPVFQNENRILPPIIHNNELDSREITMEDIKNLVIQPLLKRPIWEILVNENDSMKAIEKPYWDQPILDIVEGSVFIPYQDCYHQYYEGKPVSLDSKTPLIVEYLKKNFRYDTLITNRGEEVIINQLFEMKCINPGECSWGLAVKPKKDITGSVIASKKTFPNGTLQTLNALKYYKDTIICTSKEDEKYGKISYLMSSDSTFIIAHRGLYEIIPYTETELEKWWTEHDKTCHDPGNCYDEPEARIKTDIKEFRIAKKVDRAWKITNWQTGAVHASTVYFENDSTIRLISRDSEFSASSSKHSILYLKHDYTIMKQGKSIYYTIPNHGCGY